MKDILFADKTIGMNISKIKTNRSNNVTIQHTKYDINLSEKNGIIYKKGSYI